MKSGSCWHCGQELNALEYGRGDICRKCGRDTRVCKGCEFYDTSCNNECREPNADRQVEKERSNFCDYFKPGTPAAEGGQSKDEVLSAAEALFKKS